MSHQIRFKNTQNDWSNGLPLGNGVFGAMGMFCDGNLTYAMNHYEIYYHTDRLSLPLKKASERSIDDITDAGKARAEARARADGNRPPKGERSYWYYRGTRGRYAGGAWGKDSKSHPLTGEISFALPRGIERRETDYVLDIEHATVAFSAKGFSVKSITAREDCMLHFVKQKKHVLKTIDMIVPEYRDQAAPVVDYFALDSTTFGYTIDMSERVEEPFKPAVVVRLVGATGKLQGNRIAVEATGDYTVMVGVFTPFRYADPVGDGARMLASWSIDQMLSEHAAYWEAFFERSNISLPDKFIEKIWYVNQYAFDCSSGKGGVMKHQACGLNGLWDVKRPTLWGSKWYWDVNIQAAFAGVYSSNRIDLGHVFAEGLKQYVPLAEYACREVHGVDGIAIDYPFKFYHSCWPWCAAYLWDHYLYTEDKEFLKNDAYPIFMGLCRCAVGIFEWREERGEYMIYPDISPEQGPLGHNSVITVSSVKHMLKFTLEAAKILGDKDPLHDKIAHLLSNMPAYPKTRDGYGERLLDSEDAPPNLGIRHPSMLMPIFPTGEIHMGSSKRERQMISNTISWLEDHAESGVFHVSWLAAASARLGEGQRALRLLYEKGIDLMLRTNGLAAEETDRFIHHSLTLRQPLYYPCMMEFTGEMLAAVNEMLMQSDNGIIRIFPALPDGDRELDRLWTHGIGLDEWKVRNVEYKPWRDLRFDKLLARGAFEISAEMKGGKVKWITVHSKNGNDVTLTSPFYIRHLSVFEGGKAVPFTLEGGVFRFKTEAGKTYVIAKSESDVTPREEYQDDGGILERLTATKRRIYIGEDTDAQYHQMVGNFTRNSIYGVAPVVKPVCYKFDFTETPNKRYWYGEFDTQATICENPIYIARDFVKEAKPIFTPQKGYGFRAEDEDKLTYVVRNAPDLLRGDFLEGTEPVEFMFDAPRGGYDLLVCSGDCDESSITILEAVGGRKTGGEVILAGRYQTKRVPVVHEHDGNVTLRISTKKGHKYKLNFIFVNKTSAFY